MYTHKHILYIHIYHYSLKRTCVRIMLIECWTLEVGANSRRHRVNNLSKEHINSKERL